MYVRELLVLCHLFHGREVEALDKHCCCTSQVYPPKLLANAQRVQQVLLLPPTITLTLEQQYSWHRS